MLSMSNAARAEAPANIPTIEVYDRMRIAARWGGVRLPDMAEYLDVRPETVSRWINGKIVPSRQTLRLWALRTGVSFEWLETGNAPSP